MTQPYILAFVGENANGILRWVTEKNLAAMAKFGFSYQLIDLMKPDASEKINACLAKAKPAFCFSYQGMGTDLRIDTGENLWVRLKIPFITHLNDNPYHCTRLHVADGPGIYRLFCCEDFLETYARYYQGKAFASVLQLGYPENPCADSTAWRKRAHEIVFVKTGVDSGRMKKSWDQFPSMMRGVLHDAAELVLSGEDKTVATLCERVFNDRKIYWGARKEFFFSACSMVDFYVRAVRGERMVKALMAHNALIFGDWSHLDQAGARARFLGPIPATELDALYADTRVLINTLPAMRYGIHERILAGFNAKSAVISDSTPFLARRLKDFPSFFGVDIDHESFADELDQALTTCRTEESIEEKIQTSAIQAQTQFSHEGFVKGLLEYVPMEAYRQGHTHWCPPRPAKETV